MPPSTRRTRFSLLLFVVAIALWCIFQRAFYSARVAMLELRYSGLFLLLLAAFLWVLVKLGPRNRE